MGPTMYRGESSSEHTLAVLQRIAQGEDGAKDELYAILYPALRELARIHLRRERPDHTLQSTALVHEVYLRLVGQQGVQWQNRAHFLAVASTTMRRILVDHARRRASRKRVRPETTITLRGNDFDWESLLTLNMALDELRESYPRKVQVVELLFFGGMTTTEAAEALSVNRKTIQRDWVFARAWLRQRMALDVDG